jgi:CyaY protein
MTNSEFQTVVDRTLNQVELHMETVADALDLDVDLNRAGSVLNIVIKDCGTLVLNSQGAVQELWLAAKCGGFHYRWVAVPSQEGGYWQDSRSQAVFHEHFVQVLAQQLGPDLGLRYQALGVRGLGGV